MNTHIEKKKASSISTDASLSAPYIEKLSSGIGQLSFKDNFIGTESTANI